MTAAPHRLLALDLITQAGGAVGSGGWDDLTVEVHRVSLCVQALAHAQLAAIDLVLQQLVPAEPTAERLAPYVPVPRVLYRDRDGDVWSCDPTGRPWMLGERGDRWVISGHLHLSEVEAELGPLHVVPWPGEVR